MEERSGQFAGFTYYLIAAEVRKEKRYEVHKNGGSYCGTCRGEEQYFRSDALYDEAAPESGGQNIPV